MKRGADNTFESPRFSMTMHHPPYDQYEKTSVTALAKLEEKAPRRCSQKAIGTTLVVLGAVLVLVAVAVSTVLPPVIDDTVRAGVVTCSTDAARKPVFTDMYGDCSDCTPYYTNLYMFNATNVESYLNALNGTTPKLHVQEVGPYAYRKRQVRLNVTVANNRVTYKQYTYYTFEPTKSCGGCKDTDVVIGYDTGYLNVMAQAGGEHAFLIALALGTFAAGANVSDAAARVAVDAPQLMRWVNGLNSLDAHAMQTVTADDLVLKVLLTGPSALANVTMTGFAYNGLFARRTVRQWALGSPSLLAGLGLGANFINVCQHGGLSAKCASCTGDACVALAAACTKCAQGKAVVALNPVTCGAIESIYAATFGAAAAKSFAAATCSTLCSTVGLCAAPLPGAIEPSGLDFATLPAPAAETLGLFVQRTGCDDAAAIGKYEAYAGALKTPIWATLDARRNPTLAELAAFSSYSDCTSPAPNVTCSAVEGSDGLSIAPAGVGLSGFHDALSTTHMSLYLDQTKTTIAVAFTGNTVTYNDILLHRFAPATDLLSFSSKRVQVGAGVPVDGVQSLAFTSGFLAYLSFPMFLYGAASLLDDVDITMRDGRVASHDVLYTTADGASSPILNVVYAEQYLTFLDVEAATGKTMRARKRLQASYALSRSSLDPTIAMTDVLWPGLKPEVIVPAYWGEDAATIGDKQVESYRTISKVLAAMVPTLIVGPIVGLALVAWGVVKRRRSQQLSRAHASSII